MKICPKCNIENTDDKKFCKTCGSELVISTSLKQKDNNIYFGILALLIPINILFNKIIYKILMVNWGESNSFPLLFILNNIFYTCLLYSIPILIALKIKNIYLKIFTISLSSLIFILQILSQFPNTFDWNDFWYK